MKICPALRDGKKKKSVTLFDVLVLVISYKKICYIPCTKCQNIRENADGARKAKSTVTHIYYMEQI